MNERQQAAFRFIDDNADAFVNAGPEVRYCIAAIACMSDEELLHLGDRLASKGDGEMAVVAWQLAGR